MIEYLSISLITAQTLPDGVSAIHKVNSLFNCKLLFALYEMKPVETATKHSHIVSTLGSSNEGTCLDRGERSGMLRK